MVNIGLLGFGTVGQGVVDILNKKSEEGILAGKELNVKKVLVRDLKKEREVEISKDKLTLDPYEIIEDDDIDIIVELTGDVDLSYQLLKSAMKKKKHVVTANKALVSAYFEELSHLAQENGVYFLYEASVAGGIPVLKPLKDQIKLNKISKVQGILNGTCNYILSKMTDEFLDYDQVLGEAQKLGYAEADPSSDVEGTDTMRKLRILATMALGASITEDDIICDGIDSISALDIQLLRDQGRVVKLIGEAKEIEGGFQALVQPKAVKLKDYFAGINDAYNSVSIEGNFSGPLKFFGAGAGMHPTANAVLTDIVDCLLGTQDRTNPLRSGKLENRNKDIRGKYYLRISNWKDEDSLILEGLKEAELIQSKSDYAITTKEVKLFDLLEKIAEIDKPFALINLED